MKRMRSGPDIFKICQMGRREKNEDVCLAIGLDSGHLLAVADGLGGCPAGEVASGMAIDLLKEEVMRCYSGDQTPEEAARLLKSVFLKIHESILREGRGPREGMGTTLTAAIVDRDMAIVANTGDSRAYILRNGVRFRTKDHSPVERLLSSGMIDEETARFHPFKYIVDCALGINFAVDTYIERLTPEDILLLSTDGLHDHVAEQDFIRCTTAGTSREIAYCLFESACSTSMDNITLIVYRP